MSEGSKSSRTRQRILDAGAQVFSERGYAAARLSDIADAAGIQTGSLYYHFASREELVGEILRLGMVNARDHVEESLALLPADATPLARLAAAIRAHVGVVLDISDYAAAHSRIVSEVPPDIKEAHLAQQRDYGAYWHELLTAARDSGELDAGLDLFVARMLIFGAMNAVGEWYAPARGHDPAQLADQAASVLIGGLARRPDPEQGA